VADSSLEAAEADLRARISWLLLSPSVQRINFRLAKYLINGFGFHVVIGLLRTHAIGVAIDPDAISSAGRHVDAEYDPAEDKYYFPKGMYGMSMYEQKVIVHESVHALIDSRGGGLYHRARDNEGAAYVAEALYVLNLTDSTPTLHDGLRKVSFDIARKIRASRSAVPVVSQDDLDDLRDEVGRTYAKNGYPIKELERDSANRIANPMSIIAPLYGWNK
jgi:hypothetical protein